MNHTQSDTIIPEHSAQPNWNSVHSINLRHNNYSSVLNPLNAQYYTTSVTAQLNYVHTLKCLLQVSAGTFFTLSLSLLRIAI
jgi:hypothetical protein